VSSAGAATNATNIATTGASSSASTFYPTFVASNTSGNKAATTTAALNFVPSTGVLSSTSFSGGGAGLTGTGSSFTAGTATNATNVATTTKSDATTYYLTFVGANSSSNQGVDVGPATYNPSTGVLTAGAYSNSNGALLASTLTGVEGKATGVKLVNGIAFSGAAGTVPCEDANHNLTESGCPGTATLTANGTTTSSTFAPFTTNSLVLPALPINTTRHGYCDLLWQQSASTSDHPQLALTTNNSLTGFWIEGSQYRSTTSAVVNLLPVAVVTSAASTAVTAAMTPAATGTTYQVHVDFVAATNGSNTETITVEGLTPGGTLTLVAGSSCSWLP
jgi:hypothetical protein